ncbi:MAG TPA: PA14 domain-containing protein [Gemmataceae bacterium]|nr:PA14 domain-containing protein [Gemmataceae bacterium]
MPAVGGGFTAAGILGEYFDNPNLSGSPAFTRRDVRIDFDWQGRSPGGSNSPDYRRVGADNFSVRWTGQLVPRFSETYTFRTTSDDGVRLWIKPANSGDWVQLVNNWGPHGEEEDTRSYAMTAGQAYDVRMEYYEAGGSAVAQLTWSSPSTPEEVIDPAVNIGVNAVTYDYEVYADAAKGGRAEWGDPNDYFNRPNIPTDSAGWPLADGSHIIWEGEDPTKNGGVYLLRFRGRAEVSTWFNVGRFRVNGTDYGNTLPSGAGYDPGSNMTTAQVVITGTDLLGLTFRRTQRDGGSGENTGVRDIQFLRPVTPGSGTTYRPDDVFDRNVKNAFSRFTTLRYLTANFNPEREWWDRKLPSGMKVAWGDRRAVWEYEVMLANETGKDLYITIPINASDDYVRRLAKLIRFGSDGVNPYEGPVNNPTYPGLNPNLRIYVEWGNEVWNWGFSQASLGMEAARSAVRNNTPEGQIINFDGRAADGDFRRWAALKTVQASNTFRRVWGDEAMGDKVRVVLEYQYDNNQDTALEALRFLDAYFNNGDGRQHVSNPQPVSYYVWGAGGATYFGASNPRGLVDDINVPDGSFEQAPVASGHARPGAPNTPWTFNGDAGVYRDADGYKPNDRIGVDGVGAVPTTPQGQQALYVSGNGTAFINVDFPRGGVYAFDFRAAAEFGGGMANPVDFYFDDQKITPRAADLAASPGPWVPGTGFGRNPEQFVVYGTVPFYVPGPGRHTFKIVGRGRSEQTTLIDDVRVASPDAIFASRLPGGGQAAGQVSFTDYQAQMIAQAKYALAFGLKVVAYEGGWSLGGDTESVPLQSWAKYKDGRAAGAMSEAIDAFFKAGGELNILGTYDQWQMSDSANADDYPLVRGIDSKIRRLPAEPTAGVLVPGTMSVSSRSTDITDGKNDSGFTRNGEWVSWNVLASSTGDYRVSSKTSGGGRVEVFVDGDPITDGGSGGDVGDTVRLTKGVHSVRVQNSGGEFQVKDVKVKWVGPPSRTPPPIPNPPDDDPPPASSPPASPPPVSRALARASVTAGLPGGWQSQDVGNPAVDGGTRVENGKWTVQGGGTNIWGSEDEFQFANKFVDGDATLVARADGIEATHDWAKGGLMVRAGSGPSAPFAALFRTAGNGVSFEWRARYRGAPRSIQVDVGDGAVWLKLVRRGNSLAAYYSKDGRTWTRVGAPQSVSMPTGVLAGLAVTSHDVNRRTTASFSGVSVG